MPNETDPSKPGQQGQGDDASADDTRPVTMADLKKLLTGDLPGIVNSAVTSQLKRSVGKDLAALKEGFAKLTPKPAEAEGSDAEADDAEAKKKAEAAAKAKASEGQPGKPVDPEVEALKKAFQKLQREASESKAEATKERRQRIEEAGYGSLRTALTGKVAPGAEALALDALKARGQVAIGDDGAVRLKLRATADEPDEGLDLDSGITAFLKSKEAAFLLPAPNSGAAGGKKPTPPPPLRPGARPPSPSPIASFEAATGKSIDELL